MSEREQHGFRLIIEVVELGDYTTAFGRALELADEMNGELDEAHILVEPTGESLFQTIPNGVFCEGCEGCTIPGVRWPTATNCDESHEWVERCDTCQRYDSDEAAYRRVLEEYGADVIASDFVVGEAIAVGTINPSYYVDRKVLA